MRCYYAHCIALYDTPQEKRDIATLEALGFDVVNPNNPDCQEKYAIKGMHIFCDMVSACDCVAFRALPDGRIPSGVAKELEFSHGKPVIELPSRVTGRMISIEETREYLHEVGER